MIGCLELFQIFFIYESTVNYVKIYHVDLSNNYTKPTILSDFECKLRRINQSD